MTLRCLTKAVGRKWSLFENTSTPSKREGTSLWWRITASLSIQIESGHHKTSDKQNRAVRNAVECVSPR